MQLLEDIRLLLPSLGFPLLNPLIKKQQNYFCKGPYAEGKGTYTEEGFVVEKGSRARKEWAPSVMRERSVREQLVVEGVLEESGDSYIFTRDYLFRTPSRAAVFILARAANGWTEWKDENGKTLDENERQK